MADVSGTEVHSHYKRENKHGVTTLTFRKRRYMLPKVILKPDEPLRASTGDLQNAGGACVMVDVGMFCPHCSGAISAKLSGSHSKLVLTKPDDDLPEIEGRAFRQLQSSKQQRDAKLESIYETSSPQSKEAVIKRIKTAHTDADLEEVQLQMTVNSCDQHKVPDVAKLDFTEKLSSSDYESLDRDSRIGSLSSKANSVDTNVSVSASTSTPKNPYSSMNSSGFYDSYSLSRENASNANANFSSLPRNLFLNARSPQRIDDKTLLDSMLVEVSDANGAELIKELLGDEVVDEEYQNFVSGANVTASNKANVKPDNIPNWQQDYSFNKSHSEDYISDRSASPETYVDDILENVRDEVFSGDVTLPRVFALHKEKRKMDSAKRKLKRQIVQESSFEAVDQERTAHTITGNIFHGAIPNDRASTTKQETVNQKCRASKEEQNSGTTSKLKKSPYYHEDLFEEVVEALTELESGFATDWTSDYDSDRRALSTPDSDHLLLDHNPNIYINSLGIPIAEKRKPPSSSCECIADDHSRDLDSSLEHVASFIGTPSDISGGDFSVDGYGSSSECSYFGQNDNKMNSSSLLLEQLIQETQNLTESLAQYEAEEEQMQFKDQYDATDEVFLQRETSVEYKKASCERLNFSPKDPIPLIIEPPSRDSSKESDSDDNSINEASSLDNLLTCNAIHASTSDLDEPYSRELEHAGIFVDKVESDNICERQESSIEKDFEKCLHTKTKEVDDFVPVTPDVNEAEPEILQKAQEAAQCVASFLGSSDILNPKYVRGSPQKSRAINDANKAGPESKSNFVTTSDSGEIKTVISQKDNTVVATKEGITNAQAKQLVKYILDESTNTEHLLEHTASLDKCLDQKCQTCQLETDKEDEVVKNEEVTTREVTLVFKWPKKLGMKPKLAPVQPETDSGQPFRTIHLRRVMRISDFDIDEQRKPKQKALTLSVETPSCSQKAVKASNKNNTQEDEESSRKSKGDQQELYVHTERGHSKSSNKTKRIAPVNSDVGDPVMNAATETSPNRI